MASAMPRVGAWRSTILAAVPILSALVADRRKNAAMLLTSLFVIL